MKYIYSLVILTLLFGCSQMPEIRYFTIAHKSAEAQTSSIDKELVVKNFSSEPMYQQDQFIYRPSEYEIKFDHYRRWVQSPPQILTKRLMGYLNDRNVFKKVSSESYRNEGYLQLECSLKQFEEVISGTERNAKVGITYKLLQMPQKIVVKSGSLENTEVISDKNTEEIVKALSTATFNVFRELAEIIEN